MSPLLLLQCNLHGRSPQVFLTTSREDTPLARKIRRILHRILLAASESVTSNIVSLTLITYNEAVSCREENMQWQPAARITSRNNFNLLEHFIAGRFFEHKHTENQRAVKFCPGWITCVSMSHPIINSML